MKRFISALALCASLFVLLTLFLFPPSIVLAAKENAIMKLLNLPAPPPPNPLVRGTFAHDEKFYDPNNPPRDDAPIEDLIDYWTNQNGGRRFDNFVINYSNRPSARVMDRLMAEMQRRPELASQMLGILPNDKSAIDAVKALYDSAGTEGGIDRNEKQRLRDWLKFNSPYFSRDLERVSQQIKDENNYVSQNNENSLLALTQHDFEKAGPIINQLYNDGTQPVSKVLATWALYRHALATDSLSDIERYRSELMRMVEDRNASEGVRDKANDALMLEKDFPGREDWAFTLFEDETFVAITRYTATTTLIRRSSPDKYAPKLIAILKRTSNPTVREAAARNLVIALNGNPGKELEIEIITSLLPWLENAKWATDAGDSRQAIVRKLAEYQIPESVPGLINMLDEKERQLSTDSNSVTTNVAPPVNIAPVNIAPAVNVSRSSASSIKPAGSSVFSFTYRQTAIPALGKQKDGRAVPALRRVLSEINGYERVTTIKAILDCGGFTIAEQMAALENAAKGLKARTEIAAANAPYIVDRDEVGRILSGNFTREFRPKPITSAEISIILGDTLINAEEISDALARAIVDRIEELDGKDQAMAGTFRRMILKWENAVINVLLLRDVKRDIADADTIVRLLSQRKSLREQQAGDVADLRNGKPSAAGIGACLFEDQTDYATILANADAEAKAAMLACARLIRSPLPVAKVAENLKSQNPMLQIAAERYLESEDSPEARAFVLGRHQNEAMILGATSAFYVNDADTETSSYLWSLYRSLGDESLYNGWGRSYNDEELDAAEKQLQAEVKRDLDLLGVYAYDGNYIRIYKDRVMFSWDEDDSRYRERPLTSYEFEEIKSYFTANRVDELPPFLSCGGDYCMAKELVMLGRNGGRRVYMNGGSGGRPASEFFAWLDKYFADLKLTRATLKYALSREIPGLEILLASDELHAETVWAQGSDVRVAASDVAVSKKIDAEIENAFGEDAETDDEAVAIQNAAKKTALKEKRKYDGFAWYKVADGTASGIVSQPPQVEFIPPRDGLAVQAPDGQWKARAGDVELRASTDALFKNVRGRLTKIRSGAYENLVITPNGRWAVAAKSEPENEPIVVSIDLVSNREYPIEIEGYGKKYPVAYIPTLNKILVVNTNYYDYHGEYEAEKEDAAPDDVKPEGMFLLDAATGVMQAISGEFRPLAHQSFRALQASSKPNESWAAIYDPEKKETQIGIYDARVFAFKPVLRVPKIKFNSMSLWVDETAGKAYFVYRGHLLMLPLRSHNPLR